MDIWNHPLPRSSFAPRFSFPYYGFVENNDLGAIMFPFISLYRLSSFNNTRVVLPRIHRPLLFVQRYSSAIRPPVPPYSPATGTKRRSPCVSCRAAQALFFIPASMTVPTFDTMVDSRRQQARRTVLIHVREDEQCVCHSHMKVDFSLVAVIRSQNCTNCAQESVQSTT